MRKLIICALFLCNQALAANEVIVNNTSGAEFQATYDPYTPTPGYQIPPHSQKTLICKTGSLCWINFYAPDLSTYQEIMISWVQFNNNPFELMSMKNYGNSQNFYATVESNVITLGPAN